MTTLHGSCHCGAVTFEIEGSIESSYTCDCSLCRKKNALMAKVHESKLKITAGADKLSLYQWNTRIARHYFCSVCGIYPFHRKRSDLPSTASTCTVWMISIRRRCLPSWARARE